MGSSPPEGEEPEPQVHAIRPAYRRVPCETVPYFALLAERLEAATLEFASRHKANVSLTTLEYTRGKGGDKPV